MLDSSESEEDLGDDCLDWNYLDDNEALDGQSLLEKKVKTSLVDWVVECNIPRSHVNNLLLTWKAVRIPTTIPENESFFVCPLLNHSVF